MAFILKKTASVTWPVTVKKASDGGKFKEYKFNAVFKEVGRDRFNELIDEGDEALTDEILLGWEGIQDETKAEIPFNEDNKKALLDDFTVMKAVIEAYGELITGGAAKKLEEAAKYWAQGGVVDERDASLEAFGATPEQIAAAKEQQEEVETDFEVCKENWDIVIMFIRMSTQWHVSMAGLTGLNYSSLEYLCKLYEVEDQRLLFEGIQVMEMAALSCMQKKK